MLSEAKHLAVREVKGVPMPRFFVPVNGNSE
jgi:hypothetical protein